MKKTLLLLVAGAVAITAGAQERQVSIFNPHSENGKQVNVNELRHGIAQRHNSHSADRTTGVGGSRWYFYGDYLDTIFNIAELGTSVYPEFLSPWADRQVNDTLGEVFFTDGTQYTTMVSMGTILNPSDSAFNDENLFPGDIKITSATPYSVDSVELLGVYGYNVADSNTVDTIRLTFVYGSLSSSSTAFLADGLAGGGEYGAASFPTLPYDSITNISQPSYTTPASNVQDIYLNNHSAATGGGVWSNGNNISVVTGPAWGDTDVNGNFVVLAPLTTHLTSVPGSDGVGVSESFFSGKPSPIGLPGDTLADYNTHATGNFAGYYKYNSYEPYSYYATNGSASSPTAEYPPYTNATNLSSYSYLPYTDSNYNLNTGLFKELPNSENGWTDAYLPTWAWSAGSGAAVLQYPYIDLHIVCSTCDSIYYYVSHVGVNNVPALISTVNAYPNPANGSLNVAFNLTQSSVVTVTLTDMVGEVVATQTISNTMKGNANFNTTNLAEGMYIYTLNANGQTSTGHFAIVH